MSNSDSFIDEVNEEVRRDRFYAFLRRYGWIAIVAVLVLVGGAAFVEYRKAQDRATAEALGDAMLAAISNDDSAARATALANVTPSTPASESVLKLMTAAEQVEAGDKDAAVQTLDALAVNPEVPMIYRQLAQFKALALQGKETPASERRQALEAMAAPGNPLRLLASEQMALIDIETGDTEAAMSRYQAILSDAEATSDLQQRALQVIVALGGEPEMDGAAASLGETSTTAGN
ncbi:hypothetical protein SAMN04488523_11337 [Sulfitobacter brevis]|uniref:Tetratricopeptide repeat-like domain-containing protein n=1 Tax=Sulfitobacter brevis TaxID=74348 RepID=A0A1I2ESF0_9RHOB|nr:hypothetical protein [Sulfitobacter brevis]SFE95547.1 hypothetical protein SAMN04488523_11337 [Sulfitobacter brevis]